MVKRKNKDPNAPKRPKSSYIFFMAERRLNLKAKNPNLSFVEVGKVLGQEWRNLSDRRKQKYVKLSAQDKERYQAEMSGYTAPAFVGEVASEKRKKDPNAPKRAKSSYIFFTSERRVQLKNKNPNLSFVEVGKIMGQEWRNLSDRRKQKYIKMNAQDKERYALEMAVYVPPTFVSDDSGGKKRKKKDPNAPKKPKSAYLFFATARREQLQNYHPGLSFAQCGKIMGQEWRGMSAANKKVYDDMNAADKMRHAKEMERYTAMYAPAPWVGMTGKSKRKKKKKDPNAPKKPKSAYLFFATARREQLNSIHPGLTFGQCGKILGEEWRNMNSSSKKVYENLNAADKNRYAKAMANYIPGPHYF